MLAHVQINALHPRRVVLGALVVQREDQTSDFRGFEVCVGGVGVGVGGGEVEGSLDFADGESGWGLQELG